MKRWMSGQSVWIECRTLGAVVVALATLGVPLKSLATENALPGDGTPMNESHFQALIQEAQGSPTAKKLLDQVKKHFGLTELSELRAYLMLNRISKTDAVLTRQFDPATGEEKRIRKILVHLKQDQALDEQTLDLIHELVHATFSGGWDPYDPNLSASKYLWIGIEAAGGEVDALQTECQAATELQWLERKKASRCVKYLSRNDLLGTSPTEANPESIPFLQVVRQKVVEDFYRVGGFYPNLLQLLGASTTGFPFLSSDRPPLISSTGQVPYPVALYREFQALNEIACRNTLRRKESLLESLSGQSAVSTPQLQEVDRFIAMRCKG